MKTLSVVLVFLNLCISTSFCQTNFTETINGVCIDMVFVEGGIFQMGSSDGKKEERPIHSVSLSNFYISKFELTQGQWEAIMGKRHYSFEKNASSQQPVFFVSWNDTQVFLNKFNGETNKNYRLPTEAEWEYAARGGAKSKGFKYAGSNTKDSVAWWSFSNVNGTISDKITYAKSLTVLKCPLPVGLKKPNELGIYDMNGNVAEWCSDWFEMYSPNAQINPTGPSSGKVHVVRGGGYYSDRDRFINDCSITYRAGQSERSNSINSIFRPGIRLALSIIP